MITTVKTTVKLSSDDVRDIIRSHFNLPKTADVNFDISNTSPDWPGAGYYTQYSLISASVNMEVEVANLKGTK